MVMHARKIQRLNDGYYDRNTTHPFEEKYPSKSHSTGYNERHGNKSRESPNFSRNRESGSPTRQHRYPNKSSYIERNKDRLEKGASSSPGDRRANHHASNSTSSRDGEKGHANHDYSQKEKEAIEIHKNALRVSGDWSEHVSTSGKHYYYNYKTEVSKWEKPKEWVDPPTTPVSKSSSRDKNGRDRDKHYTSSKSSEDRYRHSSDRGGATDRAGRSSSISSSHSRSDRGASSASHPHTTTATSSTYSEHRQSHHSRHSSGEQNHHGRYGNEDRSSAGHQKPWIGESREYRRDTPRTSSEGQYDRYRRGECPTTPSSIRRVDYCNVSSGGPSKPVSHSSTAAFNGARTTDSLRNENEDSRQMEDMDISPSSTPSNQGNSRPGSRPNSRQGTPAASTPVSLTTAVSSYSSSVLGAVSALPPLVSMHAAKTVPSADLTQQAIQTLQKLHQALLMQQLQQQTPQMQNGAETTTVSSHLTLPQVQSTIASTSRLHPEDPRDPRERREHREHRDTGSSPTERKSRRESPTPNINSSQPVTLGTSSLAAATRKQDSVLLAPSLVKYYKEELIGHVLGWQSDQTEKQARQANRFSEDTHSMGSIQATQVSVELKKARSLVRIAEIQSTLQEQRLMFSRQLIKELDNLKNMNSFMPYQDT